MTRRIWLIAAAALAALGCQGGAGAPPPAEEAAKRVENDMTIPPEAKEAARQAIEQNK